MKTVIIIFYFYKKTLRIIPSYVFNTNMCRVKTVHIYIKNQTRSKF